MGRLAFIAACILTAAVVRPRAAGSACNLIPGATTIFSGEVGGTNRPFAAPGEAVELTRRTCDSGSAFSLTATDQLVSLVFQPTSGARNLVVLTADPDCTAVAPKLAACGALPKGGMATCVPWPASGLKVFDRNATTRVLSFTFPDTESFVGTPSDRLTLSGPVAIAVSDKTADLPCGLVTESCSGQSDLRACVDRLYANAGSCGKAIPNVTFQQFTALPPPNDAKADCFAATPPCNPLLATDLRFASDVGGNLLMPMNWAGVLLPSRIPVPRLLRSAMRSPLPFSVPDQVFVGSYTPEGGKLPPIFEPIVDPNVNAQNTVQLFGSADAPYTVLRLARHAGTCQGGPQAGSRCETRVDCAGHACAPSCVGDPAVACSTDSDCNLDGPCGRLFDAFLPGPGPLAIPRAQVTTPATLPGICQETAVDCTTTCNADGPCVNYAIRAENPVTLDSLAQRSTELRSFTLIESLGLADANGDGDTGDNTAVLRNRITGETQPLGADPMCGIAGTPDGRAVVSINESGFTFPAVAVEDDLLALLESEPAQNFCEANGDGDHADPLLRVFKLGTPTELTGAQIAVDGAPVIDARSVVLSNGRAFVRRSEVQQGMRRTTAVAVDGANNNQTSLARGISANGRFVALKSACLAGDCLGTTDLLVADTCTAAGGQVAGCTSSVQVQTSVGLATARLPQISANGRYVAFSAGSNGVPFVFERVYLRDRCIADGVPVVPCTTSNQRVDVHQFGSQNGPSVVTGTPGAVSDDGRYVVYSSGSSSILIDGNGTAVDVFWRDRCVSNGVAVPGCTAFTNFVNIQGGGVPNQSSNPSMSADGRWVAYESDSDPNGGNPAVKGVFLRDMSVTSSYVITVVSVSSSGGWVDGASSKPVISPDARYVCFTSSATNIVPGVSGQQVYLRDLQEGRTEVVSVDSNGVPRGGDDCSLTADGRRVSFTGTAPELAKDMPAGGANFVHDRITGLTEMLIRNSAGQSAPTSSFQPVSLSADGSAAVFAANTQLTSHPLVPYILDGYAYVRGLDPMDAPSDLNGDGDRIDSPLAVFETATSQLTTLCPATAASVAGGSAAYLRQETAAGTAPCAGGSLNGDADTTDTVVQLWSGGASADNLQCPASAVSLSDTWLAALVSESAQGAGVFLNGDGDATDQVVMMHDVAAAAGPCALPASNATWTNLGQAADQVVMSGDVAVFRTSETAQSTILNGDGDMSDRVLQVAYGGNPAPGASILQSVSTGLAAEDFVVGAPTTAECGPVHLVALRTNEAAQVGSPSAVTNSDADSTDDVLQVYDLVSGTRVDTGKAAAPCVIDACDPRLPYRVSGSIVKFLTLEAEQGGQDLDGDGITTGLVLQTFNFCTGATTVVGAIDPTTKQNPFDDTGVVALSAGRCGIATPASCTSNADCDTSSVCDSDSCTAGKCLLRSTAMCSTDADCGRCVRRLPSACRKDAECPDGLPCIPSRVTALTEILDTDGDGIADGADNCLYVPNLDQADADSNDVGDACTMEVQALGAKKMTLSDRDGDATKRKLMVSSKDPAIIAGALGSARDPTSAGAQLTLYNPVTSESATVPLPAVGWFAVGRPAGAKGYKYKDAKRVHGPCKTAMLKPGKLLNAVCTGAQLSFGLDAAPQGGLAVAVDVGQSRYCLSFSGAEVTKDTPAANGKTGVFQARGDSAGPCPIP